MLRRLAQANARQAHRFGTHAHAPTRFQINAIGGNRAAPRPRVAFYKAGASAPEDGQ